MQENTKRAIRSAAHQVRKGIKAMDAASTGLTRADGWNNLFTGVGTSADKKTQTSFANCERLTWQQLEELYVGDGLARRIIDLPTREMTRKGFEVEGDSDGKLIGAVRKKGLRVAMRELLRWSKLYGGALGVLTIDDGSTSLKQPLRENRIKAITDMQVFNRFRTWWTPSDLYQDPTDPKYMTPQWYTVSPLLSMPFKVHESRTIRMDGLPVTDVIRIQNLGWGDSVIQAVYTKLRSLFATYDGAETIIDDFVTSVMSIKNLSNMLQSDRGVQTVKDRIATLDMSKHILNTMMMDADLETFQKHASSVAGLSDLLDRFAGAVSAVLGWPQTVLMGRSPAGMNATGDSDMQIFYDVLSGDQEDTMEPALQRLVYLLSIAQDSRTALPENWAIKFKPLWQLPESEEAKRRYTVSQTDLNYAKLGLTAGEIITSRFGGGHFSAETELDKTIAPADRTLSLGAGSAPPGEDPLNPDDPAAKDKATKPGAEKKKEPAA